MRLFLHNFFSVSTRFVKFTKNFHQKKLRQKQRGPRTHLGTSTGRWFTTLPTCQNSEGRFEFPQRRFQNPLVEAEATKGFLQCSYQVDRNDVRTV